MKSNFALIIIALVTHSVALAQLEATTATGQRVLLYEDSTWSFADNDTLYHLKVAVISRIEIPELKVDEKITSHFAYTLQYNEEHEQASWVAYELTGEETNSTVERTDKFVVDPLVKTKTANDKDYARSGYDRGHLAPAGDMGWSSTAMAESFYYSNMSPQQPGFNRGVWKRGEELVRNWALENGSVYIVTGPVLTRDLPTIGPNKVSVPSYFYKVILDYRAPGIKGLGFIFPNASSSESLQHFAVSVDSVEHLVGLDFFPQLPDDQETIIEGNLNVKSWTWKASKNERKTGDDRDRRRTGL